MPGTLSRRAAFAPALLALPLLLLAPASGQAQDRPGPVYQGTAYLWAAGAGGTFQPFAAAPVLEIERSFSELHDDLSLAFFMSGLVRVDRLVFLGDFSYLIMNRRGLVTIPGTGTVPAAGELRQTSLTLEGGYRVLEETAGTVDLLAGVRAWWVRADVDLAGGAVSRSPRHSFIDPILAVRGTARLADRWSATGYLDGGGFGVGSDSTLQMVGTVNFELHPGAFLSLGYRRLSVDYEDGGSRIDTTMGGPLVGVSLRF
jgi:hypothetical protein